MGRAVGIEGWDPDMAWLCPGRSLRRRYLACFGDVRSLAGTFQGVPRDKMATERLGLQPLTCQIFQLFADQFF